MGSGPLRSGDSHGDLVKSVASSVNHLEEFDSNEMTRQVCDQLNQWVLNEHPEVDWRRDSLVDTLPVEYRELDDVKRLDSLTYTTTDVAFLQEAVWLRDIANRVRAGSFDDLEGAERLFDWTVRNLQLRAEPDDSSKYAYHEPRLSLLAARATPQERALVFASLARQSGLDVVMLALPQGEGQPLRPWVAALIHGDDYYLFDPWLGFPIPGPGGKGVATLAQVVADESLLRALDLDAKHRYPVESSQLHDIVPWIEAGPYFLTQRMKLLETRLAGGDKVVLTLDATSLAGRLPRSPALASPQIWPLAYEILRQHANLTPLLVNLLSIDLMAYAVQPQLAAGRALAFKGDLDPARKKLMSARPSDIDLREAKLPANRRAMIDAAKQLATFWLGQLAFDERDYPVAVDFFLKRMLREAPDGILAPAAQYNLARSYEVLKENAKAIALYNDDDSPQQYGNRVRARRLQQGASPAP
jgi:hypothetical protein